ncbi:MAG: hypothetical protein ACLQFR_02330 [Streptosporangiaceae bacterium]
MTSEADGMAKRVLGRFAALRQHRAQWAAVSAQAVAGAAGARSHGPDRVELSWSDAVPALADLIAEFGPPSAAATLGPALSRLDKDAPEAAGLLRLMSCLAPEPVPLGLLLAFTAALGLPDDVPRRLRADAGRSRGSLTCPRFCFPR